MPSLCLVNSVKGKNGKLNSMTVWWSIVVTITSDICVICKSSQIWQKFWDLLCFSSVSVFHFLSSCLDMFWGEWIQLLWGELGRGRRSRCLILCNSWFWVFHDSICIFIGWIFKVKYFHASLPYTYSNC